MIISLSEWGRAGIAQRDQLIAKSVSEARNSYGLAYGKIGTYPGGPRDLGLADGELVNPSPPPAWSGNDAHVLIGAGNGTFGAPTDYNFSDYGLFEGRGAAINRLDLNTSNDLAVACRSGGTGGLGGVAVFQNIGGGVLSSVPKTFVTDVSGLGRPHWIKVVDIDDDLRNDIVVSNKSGGNVGVLINKSPQIGD